MKKLTYCTIKANLNGEFRHPQEVMGDLGINYQYATPQPMFDSWWFWNCENLPCKLPSHIAVQDRDPTKCVGYGISKETAIKIKAAN